MDRFILSLGFMGAIHLDSKLAWAYLLGLWVCISLFIRTLGLWGAIAMPILWRLEGLLASCTITYARLPPVNIGILMFIVLIAFISRLLKLAGGLIAPCVKLALIRWLGHDFGLAFTASPSRERFEVQPRGITLEEFSGLASQHHRVTFCVPSAAPLE